ncbi:hypothetical protein MOP88_07380 [Sphingomonas sp. WKB10]|nr:hypothetical protein [Sphingomonas sp. WKB10]
MNAVTLETLRADFEAARSALVAHMSNPNHMWLSGGRPTLGPDGKIWMRPGNPNPFDLAQVARLETAEPEDIWDIPQAVMFDHSLWADLKDAARKLSGGNIDPRVNA